MRGRSLGDFLIRVAGITVLVAACTAPAGTAGPAVTHSPAGPPPEIVGTVTAGPVCPVERGSLDPLCVPRPVAGAVIVVTDRATGSEVGRGSTGADGSYAVTVAQTGTVVVSGLAVKGLLGTPQPVTVTLAAPAEKIRVDLAYDTGIR